MARKSVLLRGSLSWEKRSNYYIQNVIDSIRSWHDDELILCTWEHHENETKALIGLDKVLLIKDPGPGLNNTKRQMYAFYHGLNAVGGEEVLVTRTDCLHFADLFELRSNKHKKSKMNFSAFNEKLLISNMMSIKPGYDDPVNTYRLSDWFQCGTIADISRWASVYEDFDKLDYSLLEKQFDKTLCTEKLWFLMLLKKYYSSEISFYHSNNIDEYAWHAIVDNFIIIDHITTAKAMNLNWAFQPQRLSAYITEDDYNQNYQLLTS